MPRDLASCSFLFARWERLLTVSASRVEINSYLYRPNDIARLLPHIEAGTIGRVGRHYRVG